MIKDLVIRQRNYFLGNHTIPMSFRMDALKRLYQAIIKHEEEILNALYMDLNKSKQEAYLSEIGVTLKEISYQMKHLKKMMKPKKRRTEISNFPAKSFISPHPYGVTLIMSPWNYPIFLTLGPLAGAIAAGNTCVIKPSNYSPNTSSIIEKLINNEFAPEFLAVVTGGREENQDLLNQKFDYIFFTGSTNVGKVVMDSASKNLTPVTLELGGKSPTIVTRNANLDLAAKRIAFGKMINLGQTCVAPDYVLIDETVEKVFLEKLTHYIKVFYGEKPIESKDYGKIVNQKHFERLVNLFKNQQVYYGGDINQKLLKIGPTILTDVRNEDPIMQEEIFGPLLPILKYQHLRDAINMIRSKPHPLALYLFSNKSHEVNEILNQCQFGGGCINDTIMQVASDYLPFGGVGDSGMGQYHGKASFDTFSHNRSVIKKANWLDLNLRYRPFTGLKEYIIRKVLK